MNIPKILHQTSKDFDDEVRASRDSFLHHHPDWAHRFWTDLDCLDLVETHFPEYFEAFCGLNPAIKKWDAIRSMILYVEGGMYTDVDVQFYGNLERHFQGGLIFREPVLDTNGTWLNSPENIDLGTKLIIGEVKHIKNHFMAAVPQHHFFQSHINFIFNAPSELGVFEHAGGDSLATVYNKIAQSQGVKDIQFLKQTFFHNVDFRYEEKPALYLPNEVCAIHYVKASWVQNKNLPHRSVLTRIKVRLLRLVKSLWHITFKMK